MQGLRMYMNHCINSENFTFYNIFYTYSKTFMLLSDIAPCHFLSAHTDDSFTKPISSTSMLSLIPEPKDFYSSVKHHILNQQFQQWSIQSSEQTEWTDHLCVCGGVLLHNLLLHIAYDGISTQSHGDQQHPCIHRDLGECETKAPIKSDLGFGGDI